MIRIICPIHNKEIVIYSKEEENLFVDDNRLEVAIFTDDNGVKYLKRFIIGFCDEQCETIKQILEEHLDTDEEEDQSLITKYNNYWAKVDGFQSGDKPLKVKRTIGEKEHKFDCYVTEDLKELYNENKLLIGDKVLVTFVEGDINKPLATDKIVI